MRRSAALSIVSLLLASSALCLPVQAAPHQVEAQQAAPQQAEAQQASCPALHIAVTPGTGESNAQEDPREITGLSKGRNFVQEVAEQFDGVDAWQTPYPASAGMVTSIDKDDAQAMPYGVSRREGERRLLEHLQQLLAQCSDTKVALVGFSQGAHIAGDVATQIPADRVAAVYLISDPKRSRAFGNQTAAGAALPITNKGAIPSDRHGVLGERQPGEFEGLNVVQVCALHDPVCSIIQGDPVIDFARAQDERSDATAYLESDSRIDQARLLASELAMVRQLPSTSLAKVMLQASQHTTYTGERRDFTTIDGVRVDDWMAMELSRIASEVTGEHKDIQPKPAEEHHGYWQVMGYPLWKVMDQLYGPKSDQAQLTWQVFDL
ncbi:cutinase family protein [Corynebacterium pseudopelargi]|uniref:Cutinase n=1 Tax=Corynebacterium pseudopelargi TaxID=2080757 RepID=A0A3G6IUI6_9CORY|nr:cutinase family protein [Corynebacterium pseudopelargi]AZA09411.1 Cutinase [Corynebacterium pseudopelargi]